ncbi:MAG: UDP-N-acetylmuramoyl-L-alanyl-D-glutamate--2,6-diaminopimelate ligase [Candidatus Eremiobacteraeota bacterium]|nr:UDP-N-acetylmuramoyl-L-alanyl-D-glutamate--2,6-diaminopimelate ligase [Candidatus Eremiobacteraeota bacterium]
MASYDAGVRLDDVLLGAPSLVTDSRAVQPGSVFVALRGLHTDGHRFVDDAVARGARVIVLETPAALPDGVRGVVVADSARALSALASIFYGHPAQGLVMIGITGTNGKTTTAHMVDAILNEAGLPAAAVGTLGATFGTQHWPLKNTTPLAHDLHEMLAVLRDAGAKAVAMEVSSHALALQRVADVRFRVSALTNITRDHLDFHETFDAYWSAKRSLFERSDAAVLNADDPLGARWAKEFQIPVLTYSMSGPADIIASHIGLRADGSAFVVGETTYTLPIPGRFNIANALAAIGIARTLGIEEAACRRGLSTLKQVPGRMEIIAGAGIAVVVDYAHTPDALRNALRTLRETTAGKLYVVFGAGGDRDRGKRPQMGRVAAELADSVIVTSDNPRTEDPGEIAADILAGTGTGRHQLILDRQEAIVRAIHDALPGDVVLIAGKGHEPYQIIGERVLNFDDRAVAREALRSRT